MLKQRQLFEMNTFVKLNSIFSSGHGETSAYAVSMHWFYIWQCFARDETQDAPGPIDNKLLAETFSKSSVNNIPSSDYALLSPAMWQFLHDIYGGGPAVPLTSIMLPCKTEA
jgi:hypothetical protein